MVFKLKENNKEICTFVRGDSKVRIESVNDKKMLRDLRINDNTDLFSFLKDRFDKYPLSIQSKLAKLSKEELPLEEIVRFKSFLRRDDNIWVSFSADIRTLSKVREDFEAIDIFFIDSKEVGTTTVFQEIMSQIAKEDFKNYSEMLIVIKMDKSVTNICLRNIFTDNNNLCLILAGKDINLPNGKDLTGRYGDYLGRRVILYTDNRIGKEFSESL